MKVRYTATALEEIEDILTNIARDNSSAALRVSLTILATIDRVAEFPHTAVEADVPGVRGRARSSVPIPHIFFARQRRTYCTQRASFCTPARAMTELLEAAFERLRQLPEPVQNKAAHALLLQLEEEPEPGDREAFEIQH